MNSAWPSIVLPYLHVALWLLAVVLLWRYLRKDLTPRMVLSIFETEGVLSARQILAWVVALFSLFMLAAHRITAGECQELLFVSFGLFGIGGVVNTAKKIKPATTVNAQTVQADVQAESVSVTPTPKADSYGLV